MEDDNKDKNKDQANFAKWEANFLKLREQEEGARKALMKEIDHLNTKIILEQNLNKFQFARLRYSRTSFEVFLKQKTIIDKLILPYRMEIYCISGTYLLNGVTHYSNSLIRTSPNDYLAIMALKDTHLIIKINLSSDPSKR